MREMLWMTVL